MGIPCYRASGEERDGEEGRARGEEGLEWVSGRTGADEWADLCARGRGGGCEAGVLQEVRAASRGRAGDAPTRDGTHGAASTTFLRSRRVTA